MGLKPNSQKRRTQSRHKREKNPHPKNIHPFIILILTPSRSSQNLSRTSSISSPVRQACPLSKFILRESAGVNAHTNTHTHTHTHTRAEKKEAEESSVVFVVPENPPLSSKVRCRFFRCRNGGPHVPTSWNETRKR